MACKKVRIGLVHYVEAEISDLFRVPAKRVRDVRKHL